MRACGNWHINEWWHSLRKTGVHVSGKCSNRFFERSFRCVKGTPHTVLQLRYETCMGLTVARVI